VLAAVVLVAAAAGVAGWWYAAAQWVHTPTLTHLSAAQAKHRLAVRDLHLSAHDRHSDTVHKGNVIDQKPAPGSEIRKGHDVTAYVSTGPRMVTVPDIGSQPRKKAVAALKKADLHLKATKRSYSNSVDAGHAIRTQPAAGSSVRHDSDVRLVVSKGPTPVEIPSVVGKSTDEARTLLSAAHFDVHVADSVYSDKYAAGTVAGQSPYGKKAQPGTAVTITPSKGPHLYPVPDLKGKPVKAAVHALKNAGFKATVTNFFGSGRVVSQSPGGGTQERKGTTVKLLE
jgi:serine/threonine-protein kinase